MNIVKSQQARGWAGAYVKFLRSRDENLFLKIAPLIIIFGSPEILVSNLIPVVGEALDLGAFSITMLVLYKTYRSVSKYR